MNTYPFKIREGEPLDNDFIEGSWVENLRGTSPHTMGIDSTIYFNRQRAVIRRVLSRAKVLCAVDPVDPSIIWGYLVYEPRSSSEPCHYCHGTGKCTNFRLPGPRDKVTKPGDCVNRKNLICHGCDIRVRKCSICCGSGKQPFVAHFAYTKRDFRSWVMRRHGNGNHVRQEGMGGVMTALLERALDGANPLTTSIIATAYSDSLCPILRGKMPRVVVDPYLLHER